MSAVLISVVTLYACGGRTGDEAGAEEQAEEVGHEEIVRLDSVGVTAAGIRTAPAEMIESSLLKVTGSITYDQTRVSHVGPRTEGRIAALRTNLGTRVRTGQTLAVLESPEVGVARADLHEAERLVAIAHENHERELRLEAQGISSRKELLEAEAELRRAQASGLRAAERLRALGAGGGDGSQFVVTAPFDGVVVEMHATRGEVVGPADKLFTVADLRQLWIELDIYERDLARIAVGQPVAVKVAAYGERVFPGRIAYIGAILDPEKRTLRARVELPNPDGTLKPGMFARGEIAVGGATGIVVVPSGAVQEIEGQQVVFVPGDRPNEFRTIPVEVGEAMPDGRVRIVSGLASGQVVVTEGAFLLRSELAKGEIGEHGH